MATISHSDLAPSEKVHYSLAGGEFDLTAKGSYETDDELLISNAQAHPWLKVDFPAPADDDSGDEVAVEFPRTNIDAGLDQKVAEWEGEGGAVPTATTLAADDEQGDEPIVVDDDEPIVVDDDTPDDGDDD